MQPLALARLKRQEARRTDLMMRKQRNAEQAIHGTTGEFGKHRSLKDGEHATGMTLRTICTEPTAPTLQGRETRYEQLRNDVRTTYLHTPTGLVNAMSYPSSPQARVMIRTGSPGPSLATSPLTSESVPPLARSTSSESALSQLQGQESQFRQIRRTGGTLQTMYLKTPTGVVTAMSYPTSSSPQPRAMMRTESPWQDGPLATSPPMSPMSHASRLTSSRNTSEEVAAALTQTHTPWRQSKLMRTRMVCTPDGMIPMLTVRCTSLSTS